MLFERLMCLLNLSTWRKVNLDLKGKTDWKMNISLGHVQNEARKTQTEDLLWICG